MTYCHLCRKFIFYLFFDHLFQITRVLHFHTVDDDDDDDDGAFGDDTIQLHFL